MSLSSLLFFFFNDPATTEIYTLSLHDALPICLAPALFRRSPPGDLPYDSVAIGSDPLERDRSEEHTSELQSHHDLVCRLLLEKKKKHRSHHETPLSRQTSHSPMSLVTWSHLRL